MRIATRTRYGLKAVLVLASRYGEGSLSVSLIAKREGISVAYLEQILNALKKKKFVKSVRGPQGGYMLGKKPADISLKELFEALDPSGLLNGHVSGETLSDEIKIANRIFWGLFNQSIEKGLSEMSLKELLDEARKLKKSGSASPYTFQI